MHERERATAAAVVLPCSCPASAARRAGPGSRALPLLLVIALGCADARGQDEEVRIIRSPMITLPVSGLVRDDTDILLDGLQINLFVRFRDDGVDIDIPFTGSKDAFKVTVVRRSTGETIRETTYRFAASGAFDSVDFDGGIQSDLVYRFASSSRPRPPGFERRDLAADLQAEGRFVGRRGPWEVRAEGELTATDDSRKRLRREDGSKVDIPRGVGVIEFNNGVTFLHGSIGDVQLDQGVSLVNQGFQSRGFRLAGRFFSDRVRLVGGNTFGADIRGTYRGFDAFDMEHRRSAANVSADLLKSEVANITLLGSFLSVERPGASSFGIGQVVDGERNNVAGGGLRVDAWENRLQFITEYAHSLYANPSELNFVNEFGGSTDVGTTKGGAERHRLDVEVLRFDMLSVKTFAGYSFVDALYRSVQAGTTADRETWDIGLSASYDFITFVVGKNMFDNNVDNIDSILTTRQRTTSASIEFSLEEFRQPQAFAPQQGVAPPPANGGGEGFWSTLRQLIPSAIAFSRTDARVEALNADVVGFNSSIDDSEIPNQVSLSHSLSFNWNWPFGSTGFAITESRIDNRQPGRETADTEDRLFSFDQTLRLGRVTPAIRLAYGESENNESATLSKRDRQEVGLNVRVASPENWPDFAAGFDLLREKERYFVESNSALQNSWRVHATADFSKFIPKVNERSRPYLTLNFKVDETDRRSPNIASQTIFNVAGTVNLGFKF